MTWIISDIHGCYHTLLKLLEQVRAADPEAKLVFVGDYIDRGPHNREVVDLMVKLEAEGAVCLRGNHDDVVDYILSQHSLSRPSEWVYGKPNDLTIARWWVINGFGPTLDSYKVPDVPAEKVLEAFRAVVPEEHKKFFRNLPLFWENDTHFACHAVMRPGEELPRRLDFVKSDRFEEVLWGRYPAAATGGLALDKMPVWDKIGVCGHTPTWTYKSPVPIKFGNLRLIDTGAFTADGYLTAYNVQSDDWLLQATDSRDVKPSTR